MLSRRSLLRTLAAMPFVSLLPKNDLILYRGPANVLALGRGSTNPKVFRIYNTYTDCSNIDRGIIGWNSKVNNENI